MLRDMEILTGEMVLLNGQAVDKADAIRQVGQVLIKAGCVATSYLDGMLAREQVMSTYLGNGIAIPHGELADLQSVFRTAVSVLQLPKGVEWESGERAYLVIGLASKGLELAEVLTNLVDLLQEPEAILQLVHAADPMVIVKRLTHKRSETGWN
jgi:mannitol PTS system EIIA component